MTLPYIISKKAVMDLEEIWLFTVDKWLVAQAYRYYLLIIDEIDFICKNITCGKPLDNIRKGYRTTKVKSHLIFYRVVNDTVEIIRILHERMDMENRLDE